SPIQNMCLPSRIILVVCMDWLRVATPLLSNVMALGSKSQANALQEYFPNKQYFGRYVQKLRIEAGM
ncbi:hypothetical protein B0H14DRAFT_2235657, partial [Mycena olivaceomarginata]